MVDAEIKLAYLKHIADGHSCSLSYRKVHLEGKYDQFLVKQVIRNDEELREFNKNRRNERHLWSRVGSGSSSYTH
jgi:hypothetical protein